MRRVGVALAPICAVAGWGCSVDFVALDEGPIRTAIRIESEHADGRQGVQALVLISHLGPIAPAATVNGEHQSVPPLDAPSIDGYMLRFEPVVDPLTPVLDVEVVQLPGEELFAKVPLLVRTGEAICDSDGNVWLPSRLDSIPGEVVSREWSLSLLDEAGDAFTMVQSVGAPPDSLVVHRTLMDDDTRGMMLWIQVGALPNAPYDTHLVLRTAAEWSVSGPCP